MEQKAILENINFFRAQKTAEKMLELRLITRVEYVRFTTLNAEKFSPLYSDLFPKTVDNNTEQSYYTILKGGDVIENY